MIKFIEELTSEICALSKDANQNEIKELICKKLSEHIVAYYASAEYHTIENAYTIQAIRVKAMQSAIPSILEKCANVKKEKVRYVGKPDLAPINKIQETMHLIVFKAES